MPFKRPRKPHRTGPLKKVVRVIIRTGDQRVQNFVQLECGHRVRSDSPVGRRAHCGACEAPPEAKAK